MIKKKAQPMPKGGYQKQIRISDPEFYDQIQEVIVFNDLDDGQFNQLVRMLLRREIKKMREQQTSD